MVSNNQNAGLNLLIKNVHKANKLVFILANENLMLYFHILLQSLARHRYVNIYDGR